MTLTTRNMNRVRSPGGDYLGKLPGGNHRGKLPGEITGEVHLLRDEIISLNITPKSRSRRFVIIGPPMGDAVTAKLKVFAAIG